MVAEADVVFLMEAEQVLRFRARFPAAARKAVLLGAFAGHPSRVEIDDPYGESEVVYRRVFREVRSAVAAIAEGLPGSGGSRPASPPTSPL